MDVREKLAELIREISHDKKLYLYDLCDMFEGSEKIADLLIENGVTVQEWISVNDRLPEEDECVLVIVSGVFGNITFKNAVELAEYTAKEGWILESFPEYENPIIKWWRAIPKPPKGE